MKICTHVCAGWGGTAPTQGIASSKDTTVDLTGSIADATLPMSIEVMGSVGDVGSSAIDTLLALPFYLYTQALGIIGTFGADLGSTGF